MRGLYAILDLEILEQATLDPVDFARAVLAASPAALQLRAKVAPPRDVLALLRRLLPLCRQAKVPLFANDRPDLARLADCDGVHVGQDDLALADVRRFDPKLKVGVSTHNEAQLRDALESGPDYVAFGPVFPTTSKRQPDPTVGLETLRRLAPLAKQAERPLVAIGGITAERAGEVGKVAPAAAVISALVSPDFDGVTDNARALHAALTGIA